MKRFQFCCLRLLTLLFLTTCLGAALAPPARGALTLTPVLTGLSSPLYVTNARDSTNRLFVVEQPGRIQVLPAGATQPTLFLDIVSKVLSGGERGLLGLAFHPQFAANSRFFVNYTRQTDGATVIAEYRASATPAATAATESVLLVVAQPFANHNGGMIEFGNDGFLYIGMGDGGSSNDPGNRAQNINDLLGKILRIDVDNPAGGNPYSSPEGNPYLGATPGRDEIFAIGMRNPFRFSFDRQTGQLYVGDVGQGALEEIDLVTAGGNYGWRVYEGNNCTGLDPGLCNPSNFTAPIAQYNHSGGRCSVTGGYVYRGTASTLPAGTYVFGDFCTGEIFSPVNGAPNLLLDTSLSISSFGEDEAREIYVVGLGGTVHRLANDAPPQGSINVALAANGGVATSSSNFSAGNTPPGSINGDRKGLNWNNGGGWKSAAGLPQWLDVQFAGARTIDRVVLYDVQDNWTNPVEPTDTMTNPLYGSSFVSFTVSVWNGANWVVVATVNGNNLVKRTVTFPAVSTDRIRVSVTASADAYARLAEVEAFTAAQGGPAPTSTTLSSSLNPAQVGATVTFTATVTGTNPTGNVSFTDNGNAITGCTAVALTGGGNSRTATCSTSSLAVGSHPIVANYGGDAANAASASPSLTQTIDAPPQGSINVALAANGGVATSSSNFSAGNTPPGSINGDRKGLNWNNGGGWKSAAGLPQWLDVQFAGARTIDRVVLYDVQDNYQNPVEPTDTMTNPLYGSSFVNFTVSVWNGASWIVVATVNGNNLVKRTVTFPAVSTDRIRVSVTASADAYARLAEIEAFTAAQGGPMAAAWSTFGRDAQHTALSATPAQPLNQIHWQTPVDLQPQYSGNGSLLVHYGSPVITPANTVIVPVKTGATGGFRVEARAGTNGALKWSMTTDYILPPHSWVPAFGPALTSQSRLYFPGAGGTVYFRDQADDATGSSGQIAFYGLANYQADPQAYNAGVIINTPITTDPAGNVYFGFQVIGSTPLGLTSGIARISASGQGSWTPVTTAASDANMTKVPHNSAPALSGDHQVLYSAVSNGTSGYLVALNSTTLAPMTRVRLIDPKSGLDARLSDNGSASATVGTDGDVYFGVLENPSASNHRRGWLLHFNGTLSQSKTPGAFGWDTTVSLAPATMVPSYQGTSTYLLMTKYNHYIGQGGDGQNKIAILDPNATQTDPVTGAAVMKEVLTMLGPTPYAGGGVKEWCINTAAVDPFTKSVMANSEDGKLYRWDLTTNTLSQTVVLTAGIGEAYTSTVIGPDGKVYATNNATLFAVGQ